MMAQRAPRGAYERALEYCRARRLFVPGDRVLVGCGNGTASLGVLGFLSLARRDLGLAHLAVGSIDFGRDNDAEAVADVGRFARQLGVDFHAVTADRRTTTQALVALARQAGFTRIALGHTRDDAVARVLAQIVRGRGVETLRPLVARRRDGVVRPLLDLCEAEALELARAAGIEPVALPPDPTMRPSLEARLRAVVLPRLRVEVPSADEALLTLGREVRQLTRWIRNEARRWVEQAQFTSVGLILPTVTGGSVLASEIAKAALVRMDVAPSVLHIAAAPLARLLRSSPKTWSSREVVLGPGVVATCLPARRAVALRVIRIRHATDGVFG